MCENCQLYRFASSLFCYSLIGKNTAMSISSILKPIDLVSEECDLGRLLYKGYSYERLGFDDFKLVLSEKVSK